MISLSRLVAAPAEPGRAVAFGREGPRDGGDLRADVASLAAHLQPLAGERLLLHCDDAYAFAVGLLAGWQVGACLVLPPSRQRGALERLAAEVAGALVDTAECRDAMQDRPAWHPLSVPRASWEPLIPDRDAPLLEIFTSGTTGTGKPVAKALRHLEDEVLALEGRFGPRLGPDARVLATTSPQHLYGLLFRVAWPICAGRPFLRSALLHPEELAPHVDDATAFALATTPVALRRLVEKGGLPLQRDACRAVFSSGGPLPAAVAERVRYVLGAPPFEIYGSTESGGVGVRQQWSGGECWEPLAGVELAREPEGGRLVVTSPFASGGEPAAGGRERVLLGDRICFEPGGGFRLLGRADRVVKIGEKRLSLPAMEERLGAHPAVSEVALLALGRGGWTRVAAVVVPSPAGWEIARTGGRRALAKVLREHAAPDFDRILLPRAWRILEALPRDAQGKLPSAALQALFAGDGSAPRAPEILFARREGPAGREGGVLDAWLRIPRDLAFLEGHFPSLPLVAGVVQVHFVLSAVEDLLGARPRLETLEALKFQEVLLPGQELRLHLELSASGDAGRRFSFVMRDPAQPERIFSSGRGRLGSAP